MSARQPVNSQSQWIPQLARGIASHITLIACWLVLWKVAGLMEYAPNASVWYPPAALSLAAFIVMGRRAWTAILVAVGISTWWTLQAYGLAGNLVIFLLATLGYTIAHGGSYYLGAAGIRYYVRSGHCRPIYITLTYLLVLATLAALASAVIGSYVGYLSGHISRPDIFKVIGSWWLGDASAAIVLTPIFVAAVGWRFPRVAQVMKQLKLNFGGQQASWYSFKVLLLLLTFVVVMLMLTYLGPATGGAYLGFVVMILLLPQVWIVFTEPPLRTALSLSIIFFAVAVVVAFVDLQDYLVIVQLSLLSIALISWMFMLIPMLAADNSKLEALANTDQLTGSRTRHAFISEANERLGQMLVKHERKITGDSLVLLMFDIDHFKLINDTYGHDKGDRVLQLVAASVRENIRENDVFGRFGGDEFLVLIGGDQTDGLRMAKRIQQSVQAATQQELGMTMTLSFGILELTQSDDILPAITKADTLLFRAKREGRGRAMAAD